MSSSRAMQRLCGLMRKAVQDYEMIAPGDKVMVGVSGGKDSGVLLNLCIDYIRQHGLQRRIGVFHMDYEIQYRDTLDYVNRTLAANADILDVYRVCIPFKVQTCTSMFQQYWRPWDGSMRDIWVREMPEGSLTQHDFPFFTDEMWDYEFQNRFAEWLHRRSGAKRTCCLIGIRTQESFNRWRTIYSDRNHYRFAGKRWIRQWVGSGICNAYPLYDWLTTDVWTANGRFGWSYNRLYDLFYRAGVPLDSQRVASPFISPAIASLHLYKAIDPNTWGRMVGRVNGANFAALYGRTTAAGWQSVHLPQGMTWESYMHFLLSTLPEPIRRNYLEKLSVSIRFWRDKGGCLSDETITKLQKAGIPTVVWLSPILPFINDTEENISTLLDRCEEAGVRGILCFGMGLTLRDGKPKYLGDVPRFFAYIHEVLARRPERVFSLEELHQGAWDNHDPVADKTIMAHISNLRHKLGAAGGAGLVETVWGFGYVFVPDGARREN